jgi:hypothetical protein
MPYQAMSTEQYAFAGNSISPEWERIQLSILFNNYLQKLASWTLFLQSNRMVGAVSPQRHIPSGIGPRRFPAIAEKSKSV